METTEALECRLAGRTLSGVALRYGERARDRAEMFRAGAFQPLGDVVLDIQHDPARDIASTGAGTLVVADSPTDLRIETELRAGSAELALVRRKALRGLSVAFRSRSETTESGVRIIERAELVRIGLVDSGSYRTSLELRNFDDAWLTARIAYDSPMQCQCMGPTCTSVRFAPGAFAEATEARDILAVGGGGYANVLGSYRRGTLLLDESEAGLRVGLTNAQTDTARRIVEAAAVSDIYVRPLIDLESSTYHDEGTERIFAHVVTRALLVKPTPNSAGHRPARIRGAERRRRRLAWL